MSGNPKLHIRSSQTVNVCGRQADSVGTWNWLGIPSCSTGVVHYIQLVAYQDDGQSTEEEESVISNVVESEVETGNGVQVTEVYRTEAVLDMVQATVTGTDGWDQQAGVHTVPETEAWDYQRAWSAQMTLSQHCYPWMDGYCHWQGT